MKRWIGGALLLLVVAALLPCTAMDAQSSSPSSPSDPYKGFVGHWSGKTLVDRDKLPSTVKINVTEEKDGRGMRWDYEFGKEGEKGFNRATKMIVLKPAEGKILMHFKGSPEQTYRTMGLDRVAQDGVGQFSASDCSPSKYCRICIIDLTPNSLSYLWKTTYDGKTFDVYSEFVLTRDVSVPKGSS